MDVGPHVLKTVAQIPDHQLRQLAAAMLTRLIQYDGTSYTTNVLFPVLSKFWVDPPTMNWPPQN